MIHLWGIYTQQLRPRQWQLKDAIPPAYFYDLCRIGFALILNLRKIITSSSSSHRAPSFNFEVPSMVVLIVDMSKFSLHILLHLMQLLWLLQALEVFIEGTLPLLCLWVHLLWLIQNTLYLIQQWKLCDVAALVLPVGALEVCQIVHVLLLIGGMSMWPVSTLVWGLGLPCLHNL